MEKIYILDLGFAYSIWYREDIEPKPTKKIFHNMKLNPEN